MRGLGEFRPAAQSGNCTVIHGRSIQQSRCHSTSRRTTNTVRSMIRPCLYASLYSLRVRIFQRNVGKAHIRKVTKAKTGSAGIALFFP